jgi:hypothetical protein
MDAETAGGLASDLPDGVSNQFFDGIKKFIETVTANVRAELLKEQPRLTSGMPPASADVKKAEQDMLRKAFGFKD